ncbi:hypothetical protein [Paenibacillus sp. OV219]|uniref:hypothetical protein n=1 Tax=Paenibacillus sp. OV219 TaxID=1884377 RepID=UPI0008D82182|nr:hypothetical protein [Paenibacillus sp. OV219]SEO32296.1 hypothetical protein SAMN05518847_10792 [Paenibacillus sp. OV219]
MKKWQVTLIGISTAAVMMSGAVYVGLHHLKSNPSNVHTEAEAVTPKVDAKEQLEAANDFELTRFKFNFYKAQNIDAFQVDYNDTRVLIGALPQADRTKALHSAISNREEAAKAIRYIHGNLNNTVGLYKNGYLETTGYGHSTQAAEQMKDGIFSPDSLTNHPELYIRLAEVIDNEKAAQDLRDVAALIQIGNAKRDIQAVIYAHRIIHDLDGYVFNRPDEGEEEFGAARAANGVKPALLAEIAKYMDRINKETA